MRQQRQYDTSRAERGCAGAPVGGTADRKRWWPPFRGRPDGELDRAYRMARYSADLTRLAGRIGRLRAAGDHDGQHLRAAITAYDQILLIAAADLAHASDLQAPLTPVDRLVLEADLTLAGLRWTSADRASAPGRP